MRSFRNASINSKLVILTAIAVSTALLLCCTVFVYTDIRTMKSAKLRTVNALANVIGYNATSAIEFDDPEAAAATLSSLADEDNIELAVLYDRHGEVFATYPEEFPENVVVPENVPDLGDHFAQDHLLVVRVIRNQKAGKSNQDVDELDLLLDAEDGVLSPQDVNFDPDLAPNPETSAKAAQLDGENAAAATLSPSQVRAAALGENALGAVLIRSGMRDINAQMRNYLVLTFLVLLVSVGLGTVVASRFQRIITAPVYELLHGAQRIAKHQDYSFRVTKHGDDEHGKLCDAFNSMLVELKASRDELQSAHDQMEQRVVERTADLERAMIAAQAASRAKSDFLANMSHEIRTPMTAILGYAELICEETNLSEDGTERINTILRNGHHLLSIINAILDVSKIEAGKMEVERTECKVFEIVGDISSLLRSRATDKGLDFKVEFDGPIPEKICSDPTRIRQILVNLLGNAIKFTEQGSVGVRVALAETTSGRQQLEFEVTDTGVGMQEEHIGKVFKAFTQADETMTRRFGGTGLGLTISLGLARLLGGDIKAESRDGKGSRFVVTVDTGSLAGVKMIEGATEAVIDSATRAKQKAKPLPTNLMGKVLLVEDGPDNQRLLSFLLKKSGLNVTVAENGKIGRDLALDAWANDSPYEIIFMDMQMPIMDGYEATSQLRKQGYSLPVIALTAHAMSHDREKCLGAGCNDFVTKPVDRKILISTAEEWLEKSREILAESQTALPT